MKLRWPTYFLVLLLTATTCYSQVRERKAVFIIVDGIPEDVIRRVPTPALDSIAAVGAFIPAYVGGERGGYSQMPTISAPGYNDLLTATWAYKHNVWGNDIAKPNYNYWTIYRMVHQAAPEKKLAVFSTWLDNRTKLIGDGLPATGNIKVDEHFDGLELDTLQFKHDKGGEFYHAIDERIVDSAASLFRKEGPDLSWIYLEYTDEMGHQHGNGDQMDKAVVYADAQIGRIWNALRYREKNFNEDWVIYVTTDHGRDSLGYNHGGQTDRERKTWIVTNAKGLNLLDYPRRAGIIDITPSILSFLKVELPRDQQLEMDGVSLVGKLSVDSLRARKEGDQLFLTWRILDPSGEAKIQVATTNHFSTGGKDDYKLMATVPVKTGKAVISMKGNTSAFYKVVMEAPFNTINRWIIPPGTVKRNWRLVE